MITFSFKPASMTLGLLLAISLAACDNTNSASTSAVNKTSSSLSDSYYRALTPATADSQFQQDYQQAQQANRRALLQSFNSSLGSLQRFSYAGNAQVQQLLGLAPILLTRPMLTSNANPNGSFILDPRLFAQAHNLTGQGTSVVVLDQDFGNNSNAYSHAPIMVSNVGQVVSGDTSRVDTEESHGQMVSSIIASHRSPSTNGIAPGVQLYQANTNQFATNRGIDHIAPGLLYQSLSNTPAFIVNNSYLLLSNRLQNPLPDPHSLDRLLDSRDEFTSAYAYFKTLNQGSKAKLYIYSSGNYNYTDWINNLNPNLLQANLSNNLFGKELTPSSSVYAKLAQDPQIAKNLLIVTAIKYDPNHMIRHELTKLRYQAYNRNTNRSLAPRYGADATITGSNSGVSHSKVFISPNAIQCGTTKYDCLAGDYNYYDANYTKDKHRISGTSYAAPQVTAVAALVKQQFPFMTANQIKQTLLTTAWDIDEPGIDSHTGWGLVNAAQAVKGPAMFSFGDFVVDLGDQGYNYYFSNNIYGSGGLVVNGGVSSYLYLTGQNHYRGHTEVASGNLAIVNPKYLGGRDTPAQISSNLTIQHQGQVFAVGATLGNITNNGSFQGANSTIIGDYTSSSQATTTLSLTQPMTVHGTVKLAGKITLVYNLGSSIDDNQVTRALRQLANGKEVTLLTANNPITAQITNPIVTVNNQISFKLSVQGNKLIATGLALN